MKPNIFLIADNVALGPEDALTAYWHYLLSVVPGLGQAFVDEMCRLSGLSRSTFIGAIDHPAGDDKNHPDFLLQCHDYSVLFEHKLHSPLGPSQLHRYLDLAKGREWKLALLSASPIPIDEEVRQSPAYVGPSDAARTGHFLWSDTHEILGASDHHLAREFCDYLEILGLGRFSWSGVGNPFTDPDAARALLRLYESIRSVCNGPGVSCRKSANSLVYQVRTPFPPIHLINLGPIMSVAQENPWLRGPVMGLWVWVRRSVREQQLLPTGNGVVPGTSLPIVVRDHDDNECLPYDREVFCERSYYVPLDHVLQGSLKASEEHLVTFARTVVSHLRQDIASVQRESRGATT